MASPARSTRAVYWASAAARAARCSRPRPSPRHEHSHVSRCEVTAAAGPISALLDHRVEHLADRGVLPDLGGERGEVVALGGGAGSGGDVHERDPMPSTGTSEGPMPGTYEGPLTGPCLRPTTRQCWAGGKRHTCRAPRCWRRVQGDSELAPAGPRTPAADHGHGPQVRRATQGCHRTIRLHAGERAYPCPRQRDRSAHVTRPGHHHPQRRARLGRSR